VINSVKGDLNYFRMACWHKFYNKKDFEGLLPLWKCSTLIIGTFHPESSYFINCQTNFFYQHEKNHFWTVLPQLIGMEPIDKSATDYQINFLKKHTIGLTDLLISINDVDEKCKFHKVLMSTGRDDIFEKFKEFTWNTNSILEYIKNSKINVVLFTKIGTPDKIKISTNSFEYQMRIIESYCQSNNIYHQRLHAPSGMGSGKGKRVDTLQSKWVETIGENVKLLNSF
jgi:hypothetical protein